MFEALGGRKFIAASLTAGMAFVCEMVMPNGLTLPMASLLLGVLGAFTAGNVAVAKIAPAVQPLPVTPFTVSTTSDVEVLSRLDTLLEASNSHGQALGFLVNYVKQDIRLAANQPAA